MLSLNRRTAASALTVLTTLVCLATPATSSAVTTGAEVVLPPVYGNKAPSVGVVADSQAVAWVKDAYDSVQHSPRYFRYPGRDIADAGVTMRRDDLSLVGTQLTSTTPADGAVAVDLTTGDTTQLRPASYYESRLNIFLAGTGDGWLEKQYQAGYDRIVRTITAGRQSKSYPLPPMDGSPRQAIVRAVASDGDGAVIGASAFDGSASALDYLDFASGTYTSLGQESADAFAMDANTVLWTTAGQLHWLSRTDQSVGSQSLPFSRAGGLALSDGNVAVTLWDGHHWQLWSGPIGGDLQHVSSPLVGWSHVFPADGGDFAVGAGDDAATSGLYRYTPGTTSLGDAIVHFGATAPLGIEASSGRLLAALPTSAHTSTQRSVNASPDDTTVAASAPSTLVASSTNSLPPESSGGHSVRIERKKSGCSVVVQDATTVITRFDVECLAYSAIESGPYLLVTYTSVTDTHGVPDDGYGVVINLNTGEQLRVPETTALSGDLIAYFLRSGEIHVRNIVTGDDRVVRPAGLPADSAPRASGLILQMSGDWLFWSLPDLSDLNNAESKAVNLRTGTTIDVPLTTPSQQGSISEFELVDGAASWIDWNDRSVHLFDLSSGVDQVVGSAHTVYPNRDWLAMTDEFVAWVADDDTTHVLALNGISTDSPRYLGAVAPSAFSPDGDGSSDGYTPQMDASRPLSSWTLAVHSAKTDAVVRTLHGTAADGGVRPMWNGRNKDGKRVPDGTYTWTLTATSPVGQLRDVRGAHSPLTGRIRVDTRAPHADVRVPTVHAGAVKRGFPVRWTSSEVGSRFTVAVQIRSGHTGWSKRKPWRASTSATHARYRSSSAPYAVKHGRTFKFTVWATDVAGNRSKAGSIVVTIP